MLLTPVHVESASLCADLKSPSSECREDVSAQHKEKEQRLSIEPDFAKAEHAIRGKVLIREL